MPKHDVFLSHNSEDKLAVEELARRLVKEGINPWLDKWNLIPGEPWQEAIEDALDSCATCAIFVGPSGTGPWQNEEMRAAIQRRVEERRLSEHPFRVIPVLLPDAERGERSRLPTFLIATTWVEFRRTLDDEDAFHRLVSGIRGVEPGPGPGQAVYEGVCPYRGLQVFDVQHAPFFFGREALTEWLVNDLRGSRFLAVIGPSGSGKSSLVRAGLVPALQRGDLPSSETWPLCVFRPGHRPLESLAVALIQLTGSADDPTAPLRLMDALAADRRQLHLTTRLAFTDAPADRTIVLVVDQFEEIFTLCRDEGQRGPFVDNLLYASAIEGGRTVVVLTMRADFYGKCAAYPDLAARITDHQMLVSPMVEEELRQAIKRPAQLVGLEFESGLVETLLRDVQAEPGALPLLQHALLELWERREGHRLTFAAYREIGGVQGAIAHRAESIYADFGTTKQGITRRVMLRLTQPGEGTEDTRRRAALAELLPAAGETTDVEAVVQELADARLLTIGKDEQGGEIVDVAHEALIQGWPRLREWVEQDRAGLLTHRRLTEATEEWEQQERDQSYLYEGLRLEAAKEWAIGRLSVLNASERDFLFRSIINEDVSLQDWIPRYGSTAEIIALANAYLGSDETIERIKGLSILRWLSSESDSEINPLLLQIVLSDTSQVVSNRAAEVLCERGHIAWLTKQLSSPGLSADQKRRLTRALGHTRNRPKLGVTLEKALQGRDRRRVLQSAAVQLFSDYRTQFAIVLSFSYIAALIGSEFISQISWTIKGMLGMERTITFPYHIENLVITLIFGLYFLIRSHLDERPITVTRCIQFGLLAGLIGESIEIVTSVFEKVMGFVIQGGHLSWLLRALITPIASSSDVIIGMSIVALSLRIFYSEKNRFRNILLFSVLGPTTTIIWSSVIIPLFFSFIDGRFIDQISKIMHDVSGLSLLHIHMWIIGVFITIACLLGFRLGLRIAFGDNFTPSVYATSDQHNPESSGHAPKLKGDRRQND